MIKRRRAPFFSVVVPVYNKQDYIEECIESVLHQSFDSFELLIIDDGSTDCSIEVAKRFSDDRISIISQPNQGVSAARNTGIDYATTSFVAFLDADDFWSPEFLETARTDILKESSISFWSCGYKFFDGKNERVARFSKSSDSGAGYLNNYFDSSLADPIVTSSSVIIAKNLLLQIGGFPVGEALGEDLATWARAASRTRLFFQTRVLSNYRMEGDNNDSLALRAPRKRMLVLDELEKCFGDGELSGLRYYILYSGKNSYRQARSGRARFAIHIINRSLLTALRHGRPLLALRALAHTARLIVLILELAFVTPSGNKESV